MRRLAQRLMTFFRRNTAEAELSREISAHLQLLEDDFVAKGMPRPEARLAARRAFGGVEQAKEHQRDARGFRWMDDSRTDLRLGARMLAKYPGLSIIGGTGLAVGIAIGTAAFAFFYSYIYAVPFDGGERIVALENTDLTTNNEMRQSMHDFLDWQREMKTVQEIAAFRTVGRNLVITGGSAEPIQIAQITATGFNTPRVPPALGRPLLDTDAAPGASPVLVIGHDVWQSRFAGDPAIVGRTIRVGHIVHTIVGVMPPGFSFPVAHSYWTALNTDTSTFGRREGPSIFIFGRLRDGATMEEAGAELAGLGARAAAEFPLTHAKLQPQVMPYVHPILDIQGVTTWQFTLMQSLISTLLVIVAVNVAVLIYARTATRQGEIAVRSALGASRGRIIGQLFIEALVLCSVAAVAGVLLARYGLSLAHSIMEAEGDAMPAFIDFGLPGAALIYVAGMVLLTAVIAGVMPALHATGRRLETTLRQGSGAGGLRLGRTWTALIVAQVAIAVAGLPSAVMIGVGMTRGASTAATYDDESYVAAMVSRDPDPPAGQAPDVYAQESERNFAKLKTDLLASLEAEAIVADVTSANAMPGDEPWARFDIDGQARPQSGAPIARSSYVADDYFEAFDARIIDGRALTASDAVSAPVVLVNHAFVTQVLGGGAAVGRRLRYVRPASSWNPATQDPATTYEVVGVISNLETNTLDATRITPVVYHPAAGVGNALLLRTRSDSPISLAPRIRELVTTLDPATRLNVVAFSEVKQQAAIALRLSLVAVTLVVSSVLMLSAAGLYAMMSFTVAQRRKEIGIRSAMGADAGQLLRGIFSRAAMQVSLGIVSGVVLTLLIDVASGGEWLANGGRSVVPVMAAVMLLVGLAASFGPARRGLRIPPTEALRAE